MLRDRQISPADYSSLLNAIHSPLCDFPALVDAALKISASALSNVAPTSIWELHSDVWEARTSELESARLMLRPLMQRHNAWLPGLYAIIMAGHQAELVRFASPATYTPPVCSRRRRCAVTRATCGGAFLGKRGI